VIRRGPSKSTAVFGWDRRSDTFTLGQWVRARIYERRCDLSPDGKWFIYFAMNGRWDSETKGSWTAISMPPWLKAVTLYAKGDCWNGGGLFTGRKSYWLNGCHSKTVREDHRLTIDAKFRPAEHFGNECTGIYYVRLQRDGWKLVRHESVERFKSFTLFEKDAHGGWTLRKIAHSEVGAPPGKGCYWDEHELEHKDTGQRIEKPDWEWADLDGKRLVWAEKGQLRAAHLKSAGLTDETLLHDFNEYKFSAIEAPY
jgi:hypothetical protein